MTDRQIFDLIRSSEGYKALLDLDRSKVQRALDGQKTTAPRSALAKAAWHLARRLAPVTPPPPPAYKRVAPRTAHRQDASDARYCVHHQPGVVWDSIVGRWRDDVATYDGNGLCWGGRTDGDPSVGTVGSKEMNGRSPCELPTFGEPTKNTGSWAI